MLNDFTKNIVVSQIYEKFVVQRIGENDTVN